MSWVREGGAWELQACPHPSRPPQLHLHPPGLTPGHLHPATYRGSRPRPQGRCFLRPFIIPGEGRGRGWRWERPGRSLGRRTWAGGVRCCAYPTTVAVICTLVLLLGHSSLLLSTGSSRSAPSSPLAQVPSSLGTSPRAGLAALSSGWRPGSHRPHLARRLFAQHRVSETFELVATVLKLYVFSGKTGRWANSGPTFPNTGEGRGRVPAVPSREDRVSQSAASCSRFPSACPDPVCIGVGHPGFQNASSSGEGPGVSSIPESGVKHKHSSCGRPLSVGRMFLKKAGQTRGGIVFKRRGGGAGSRRSGGDRSAWRSAFQAGRAA